MVIFQISPIRTGTTLIWNMLQKIFSQTKVYKANQLDDYVRRSLAEDSNIKVVSTVRDPRDTLCSYMTIWYHLWSNTGSITKKMLDESIDFLRGYNGGFNDFIELCDINDNLVLRYELFWNDYDYIFTNLEDFFNITFSEETKTKIRNTTKRSVNKSIQKKLKKSGNYDFETHIHGGHIFLSEPGYSNKILGQKNLKRIQKLLECNVEEIMHIDLDK